MNSWKQFASGISSSIVSNFESLAPSGVVTKLSFISGVNVLFGCVTAYQWQQQVLGEPAVKINESGAQSMENLSWVLADQQEIILKGLTKSRGLFLFESNNIFLPRSLKHRSNGFGFERKRKCLHRDFLPSFNQKYQILMAGKEGVDTIRLKIRC